VDQYHKWTCVAELLDTDHLQHRHLWPRYRFVICKKDILEKKSKILS